MTHEERILRIEDFVDGTLAGDDLADFESHLAECETCRRELAAARRFRELGAADDPVPVPDDLEAAIRRRLAAVPGFAPASAPRRGRLLRILPYLAGAVATAAAVLLVVVPAPAPTPGRVGGAGPESGLVAYGEKAPGEGAEALEPGALVPDDVNPALSDWLVQAENAPAAAAPHLAAEARDLALLPRVRVAIASARGPEREWLRAGADLLVQLENDMAPDRLAPEARAVRRRR